LLATLAASAAVDVGKRCPAQRCGPGNRHGLGILGGLVPTRRRPVAGQARGYKKAVDGVVDWSSAKRAAMAVGANESRLCAGGFWAWGLGVFWRRGGLALAAGEGPLPERGVQTRPRAPGGVRSPGVALDHGQESSPGSFHCGTHTDAAKRPAADQICGRSQGKRQKWALNKHDF